LIILTSLITFQEFTASARDVSAEILAAAAEIVALIFGLALTIVENKKSFLSSNVLSIYWLLSTAHTGTKLRTLALGCPTNDATETYLHGGKLFLLTFIFALECTRKDAGVSLDEDQVSLQWQEKKRGVKYGFSIIETLTFISSYPHWCDSLLAKMSRGRSQYLFNCFIPLGDGPHAQGICQAIDL
jgi:hypothetical protein